MPERLYVERLGRGLCPVVVVRLLVVRPLVTEGGTVFRPLATEGGTMSEGTETQLRTVRINVFPLATRWL